MRKHLAGTLYFIAGITIFMGTTTAEIFYTPKYDVRNSTISALALVQPATNIFNTIMIISGLLILMGTYYLPSPIRAKRTLILISLFGIGILGLGVFPENIKPQHFIFAIVSFIFGSLSAITSAYMINSPLRHIFICLGMIAILLFCFQGLFIPYLGLGGTERWVVFPIVFWLTGLGGYLLGTKR